VRSTVNLFPHWCKGCFGEVCDVSGKKGTRSTGWKVKGLIRHPRKFFACAWPAERKQAIASKRCSHPERQRQALAGCQPSALIGMPERETSAIPHAHILHGHAIVELGALWSQERVAKNQRHPVRYAH